MRRAKKKYESSPEPYEDIVRLENLDPYEALIKLKVDTKQKNKYVE